MKLLSFAVETPVGVVKRVGALGATADAVIDLAAAYEGLLVARGSSQWDAVAISRSVFEDMNRLVGLGQWGLEQARAAAAFAASPTPSPSGARTVYRPAEIRVLAPIRPPVLRDFLAFEEHLKNAFKNLDRPIPPLWYEIPAYYKGNPTMIVGTDTEVRWPAYSSLMDYELELGLIVGPGGRDIPEERGEAHIYGLTIMNDFSARDTQRREGTIGMGPSKSKDFATGLGPYIVTRDEIPDLYNLDMIVRVNGEERCRGNSGTIYWRLGRLVSQASLAEDLNPGDLLATGTVGWGSGLEQGRFLQPGDVVELEISHLGVLRNRIVR